MFFAMSLPPTCDSRPHTRCRQISSETLIKEIINLIELLCQVNITNFVFPLVDMCETGVWKEGPEADKLKT